LASGGLKIFENLQDLFFIIDFFIGLNTGIYINGFLIMNRKEVFYENLKLWFWIDFLSSFPYSLIISPSSYFDIYLLNTQEDAELNNVKFSNSYFKYLGFVKT